MAFVSGFNVMAAAAFGLVVYWIGLAVYRLYFHPLTRFPGPRLAAVTSWYEAYYDVVRQGRFLWEIQAMHDQYGPIVRINPEELHINDPDYFDELYGSATRKRDKHAGWVKLAASPNSSFATVSHDLHRLRRGALNPFFAKREITRLEPVLQERVSRLCYRLQQAAATGEVIRMDAAFTALTMDVISQYSFANDSDYLSAPDLGLDWKEQLEKAFRSGGLVRHFPIMLTIMDTLPPSVIKILDPGMSALVDWQMSVRAQAKPILDRTETKEPAHRSIFHEMRDSSLPAEEKSLERLVDEGKVFVAAGTETTAATLTQIFYYVMADARILRALREALRTVMPMPQSDVTVLQLERIPYLVAVVSEGLRMSIGVTTRLPRVATEETLKYKDWVIPFGTPVSESQWFTSMNKDIFPDPEAFKPERWLNDGKYNDALAKYLVTFGRGTRRCVGMNLAYAEMYLAIAKIFRQFEMELFETARENVTWAHDFFTPVPKLDSKGVRVQIIGREQQ